MAGSLLPASRMATPPDDRRPLVMRLGLAASRAGALRIAVLALVALGLALLGSPHITRPAERLALGEFASRTIRAPYDLSIVDETATSQQRETAAANAPGVVNVDYGAGSALRTKFVTALAGVERPLASLIELRSAPAPAARPHESRSAAQARHRAAIEQAEEALDAALSQADARLGEPLPAGVRAALRAPGALPATVEAFDRLVNEAYRSPIAARPLASPPAAGEGPPPSTGRLALIDGARGGERLVSDAAALADLDGARRSLEARGAELTGAAPAPVRPWLVALAARWLKPNAAFDAAATTARREAAAAAVLPVSLTFRRNQLIVGEGQPVTRQALLVLDAIRQQGLDRTVWLRIAGRASVLFVLLLLAFVIVELDRLRFAIGTREFGYAVTSLAGTAVTFRIWLEAIGSLAERYPAIPETALVLAFPAAATAMYARVVLPYSSAVTYLAVQSICLGLLWQLDLPLVIYLLVAGLVAGHLGARCSRRQCVVQAGLLTAVPAVPVAACLAMLGGDVTWGTVAWAGGGALGGCLLSGLTLLGVGPLLEWRFGHMTRIRLIELMNYEHPLLRRLTETTPGTFQHSVTVGLLVDAAAQAVGADALLARVGALYHDVGKTERPEAFVENQHGVNPHDRLTAAESAALIIGHVNVGVRLVREFGIGERIADFVREHHGTGLVRFFFARAQALGPADPAAFSYPGPRPRSRETGLLMLADQVEATARAIDDPTEAALRSMVQQTIDRVLAEGELDECPLSLRELAEARDAFVNVLVGVHHRRIKYPAQQRGPRAAGAPAAPSPHA